VLTIGIYAVGYHKYNWVHPDHLHTHIEYNKKFRPGRALVVDGVVCNEGYLGAEAVTAWLEAHPEVTGMDEPTYATLPYR
jgi:hypothetical protein